MSNSNILVNIVIRDCNLDKAPYYATEAIQTLLFQYFTMQVLLVKLKTLDEISLHQVKLTKDWISAGSEKNITCVKPDVWDQIIGNFIVGKDLILIKDKISQQGAALVFWPNQSNFFPDYLMKEK